VNGVVGAYYFDGEAGGLVKNIFLNRIFGTTDGKTLTKSYAVFGDGSYAVNSRLNLNGGLRLTSEKKNGIAFNAGYTNDTFSVVNAVTANYNKSKIFSSIAPKVGLDYKVSDKVMAYGSLSRGFKSGGFNVRAQSTVFPQSAEPFKDEMLDVGEIGLKSTLMDGQLTLNTAVFDGKYKDIQVSTFTSYDSNGDGVEDAFFGNFLNAGNASMKGAEVEFDSSSHKVSWLAMNGYISYLDLKPDGFLDANHDGFVDTQVITNAPHWTTGLHLNVDFPLMKGLLDGERRRRVSRQFRAHERGRRVSGTSDAAAPADHAEGVHDLRRVGELAFPRRETAPRHQRQEPDEQGLSDQRLQHPVARHPDRLVRRAAYGARHDRVSLLLNCGRRGPA
jgi:iron complex outermembrane receptor protein